MKLSNRRILLSLVFAVLVLSACRFKQDGSNDAVEHNEVNNSDLHTALIQPSDLDSGWVTETYLYAYGTIRDFDSEHPSIRHVAAAIQAEPFKAEGRRGLDPIPSRLGASQGLFEYEDETTAIAAFESNGQLLAGTHVIWNEVETTFQPQMEINRLGCRTGYSDEIGNYQGCQIVARHERFFTSALMIVDDDLITLEDWEDFIIAIQERLLEYAG